VSVDQQNGDHHAHQPDPVVPRSWQTAGPITLASDTLRTSTPFLTSFEASLEAVIVAVPEASLIIIAFLAAGGSLFATSLLEPVAKSFLVAVSKASSVIIITPGHGCLSIGWMEVPFDRKSKVSHDVHLLHAELTVPAGMQELQPLNSHSDRSKASGESNAPCGLLAASSGFCDQVCVVPAWRVDEGVVVSLAV
jgi:hypothetical protein